jgi:PhnB protein
LAVNPIARREIVQLSNYLFFKSGCEEALAFYEKCGLGHVVEMQRYGENGMPFGAQGMHGKIIHAKFAGAGVLFYASDNDDAEPMRGSAHILMMDDRGQTLRLFKALADSGTVTTELGVQPWGGFYGN